MYLPFETTSLFLGIYLKDASLQIQNKACTRLFTVELFLLSKYCKWPKCSSLRDGRISYKTATQWKTKQL